MFLGGIGTDFVTVSIPDGEIEVLEAGGLTLSLDHRHIRRTSSTAEGVTREIFETANLASGPLTTSVLPEAWAGVVFIGPSFIVGELEAGGFERVEFDGTAPAPYAMDAYPTSPMVSHAGDVVSGCVQTETEPALRRWLVEDDGLAEQWSTPLPLEDCPVPLGMARDGTTFVATVSNFAFDTCLSFGADGDSIASEDLPKEFGSRPLGPAAEDDALLFGSGDPLQGSVLGADCSLQTFESPDAAIAFARLNDTGVFFAAISGQGNAMLEFGRFDALDEVTRVALGGVVRSITPPRHVDLQ